MGTTTTGDVMPALGVVGIRHEGETKVGAEVGWDLMPSLTRQTSLVESLSPLWDRSSAANRLVATLPSTCPLGDGLRSLLDVEDSAAEQPLTTRHEPLELCGDKEPLMTADAIRGDVPAGATERHLLLPPFQMTELQRLVVLLAGVETVH